ncbi:MAG: HAD family phosphatase [Candidatus Marinimicrobia bacterium]|nr:HAD family phosphatase [Candidatus Neomarinimicrobiota bacterium]MBL7067092.1 HAD family phosphatase [Candidatus Neomarinimicrobiota bacterium]
MQKIEAIIFDFDGVVVDSEPLYEVAEKRLFAEYGVTVPDEDWKIFKGSSEMGFYRLVRDRYNIDVPIDELHRKGRNFLLETFAGGLHYFPGFETFLGKIKDRYKTGLVTATSGEILDWIFRNTPIRNPFSNVITAEDVNNSKPHPEPFQKICRMMNVSPENTIVIEDSIMGIRSALAAGAITIGFLSSFTAKDLAAAHFTARNYGEIENLVFSIIEQSRNGK